jgi:hypothetical protein
MRVGQWLAAVGGCVLVAGGCSVHGTAESGPSQSPSTVAPDMSAVPVAERAAFWRDFTQRVDLAYFHGMTSPYDDRAGRKVFTGPRLAAYEFLVAYAKASSVSETPPSPRYVGLQIYSEAFPGYPKWVFAAGRRTDHGDDLGGVDRTLHLFTRTAAGAPWLEQQQVMIGDPDDVPEPLSSGDVRAGPDAGRRTDKAAKQLVGLWEDDRSTPGLKISPKLRKSVKSLSRLDDGAAGVAWLTFDRWPKLPTRSLRATGTTLSMVSFRATLHQQADAGTYLLWRGVEADLFGSGHSSSLSRDYLVTLLLSLPDDASAPDRLVGFNYYPVLDS